MRKFSKTFFAAFILSAVLVASTQAQQPSITVGPGGTVVTAGGLVIAPNGVVGVSPEGLGGAPAGQATAPYTPPYLPQGGVLGLMGVPVITVNQQNITPVIVPGCPASVQMLARNWMGQSEYQATNSARLSGSDWRVIRRDGTWFSVTQDHSDSRINFEFDHNRLTRLSCG